MELSADEMIEIMKLRRAKKEEKMNKEIYLTEKYISEDQEALKEFVKFIKESENNKDKINLIVAQTGNGKTNAVLTQLRKYGIDKTITIVPKVSQVEKINNDDRYDAVGVRGGKDRNLSYVIKNSIEYDLSNLVMTVDQLLHYKGEEMRVLLSDHVLIVDEAHTYIESADFRYKAISSLEFLINEGFFKSVVYITATPQPIIKTTPAHKLKILNIHNKGHRRKKLNFIEYPKSKLNMAHKMEIVLNSITDGVAMIYMNYSKKDMKVIQNNFEGVYLYTADTKLEDHYVMMEDSGLFPDDCKIAICTDTLTEGFDVEDSRIQAYHVFDEINPTTIIQFGNRGRHDDTRSSEVYVHAYIDYDPINPVWEEELEEGILDIHTRLESSYEHDINTKFVRRDIQEKIVGYNYFKKRYEVSETLIKRIKWVNTIRQTPREVFYTESEFIQGYNERVEEVDEKDWLDLLIKEFKEEDKVDLQNVEVENKIVNFLEEHEADLDMYFITGEIKEFKSRVKEQFKDTEAKLINRIVDEYSKTEIDIPLRIMYRYLSSKEGKLEMISSVIKGARNIAKIGDADKLRKILNLKSDGRIITIEAIKREIGSDWKKYMNACFYYKLGTTREGVKGLRITKAKPSMLTVLKNMEVSDRERKKIVKFLREKYLSYNNK